MQTLQGVLGQQAQPASMMVVYWPALVFIRKYGWNPGVPACGMDSGFRRV